MKSSASESKAFQGRSKGEINGWAVPNWNRRFLIDSDAELFMYLIQCITIRFGSWKARRLNLA